MTQCKFNRAWVGRCANNALADREMCQQHDVLTCCSCGAKATHDCAETGQFVCGFPLCNDCEHTTAPDGTNGGVGFNAQPLPQGMKGHCRKAEQRFTPWYTRDNATEKCPRCQVPLSAGIGIMQTYVAGLPDFPGGDDSSRGQTMSAGGPGEVVAVDKCPTCGFSRTAG